MDGENDSLELHESLVNYLNFALKFLFFILTIRGYYYELSKMKFHSKLKSFTRC